MKTPRASSAPSVSDVMSSLVETPASADLEEVEAPVVLIDEDGVIQDLSPAAETVLACSSEQAEATDFFQFVDDDHTGRAMWGISEVAAQRRAQTQWAMRLRIDDTSWTWCHVYASRHVQLGDEEDILLYLYAEDADMG